MKTANKFNYESIENLNLNEKIAIVESRLHLYQTNYYNTKLDLELVIKQNPSHPKIIKMHEDKKLNLEMAYKLLYEKLILLKKEGETDGK